MSLTATLAPLVSRLDPQSGVAWQQAANDLQHERRLEPWAVVVLLYAPAFVALFAHAIWRHERSETRTAWGAAAKHLLTVSLRLLAVAGGVGVTVAVFVTGAYGSVAGALLGVAYLVTLACMGVAGRVHPLVPWRRAASLLPLPDRIRAAALVALLILINLGMLLPLAARHVLSLSSEASQPGQTATLTLVDSARLLVGAALHMDFAAAVMHLPLLMLPLVLSLVALVTPLSARGFEGAQVEDAWRTDVVVSTLVMVALVVVAFTSIARTPAGSLLALGLQGALVAVAVLTAVRGLVVVARSTAEVSS